MSLVDRLERELHAADAAVDAGLDIQPDSRTRSAWAADDTGHGPVSIVVLAWLPAEDYEQAVAICPEMAESDVVAGPDGPRPHPQYCRAFEQELIELSQAGMPGLAVAPVRVAPFTAWCAEHDEQPNSECRATYAAHLARSGRVIAWPPGCNQPCWCGSGRKYKKCCATTSPGETMP
jgi:hypothetical protein